jgi:ankyrin repeat protein
MSVRQRLAIILAIICASRGKAVTSLSLSFASANRSSPLTIVEQPEPPSASLSSAGTTRPTLPGAGPLNSWRGKELRIDDEKIDVREVDVESRGGKIVLELHLPDSRPGEPDHEDFYQAAKGHILHRCPTAVLYQDSNGRMIIDNTIGDELLRVARAVREVRTLIGFMQLIGGGLFHICDWLNDRQLVGDLHDVFGPCADSDLPTPRILKGDVVLSLATYFAEAGRRDLLLAMLDIALPRCDDAPAELCREWIGLAHEALEEGNGVPDVTRAVAQALLGSMQELDGNDRAALSHLAGTPLLSIGDDEHSTLTCSSPVQRNRNDRLTELILRCREGDLDGVGKCIARGDGVNDKDALGSTALKYACCSGSTEVVELLLENRADIEIKDNQNKTPLHWACRKGKSDVVSLLIARGAKIDDKCLTLARAYGHQQVVRILLGNGAAEDSTDASRASDDATGLEGSRGWDTARSSRSPLPEPILDRLDKRDQQGKTRLMRASQGGDLAVVQNCAELGADIDAKDNHDQTALIIAARAGYKDIVEFLIDNGANVNSRDDGGYTLLMLAGAKGWSGIVARLLFNGADIEAKTEGGMTALMLAAQHNKVNVVNVLLSNGADRHAQDLKGRTAGQLAEMQRHHKLAKLLGRRSGPRRIGPGSFKRLFSKHRRVKK